MDTEGISRALGYEIKNEFYFKRAFTHSSYSNEKSIPSYERLEFLGDSILDFLVAELLFNANIAIAEGELTKMRANIVSFQPLSYALDRLGVVRFIQKSKGLKDITMSIKSDVYEAIVAAIYLDGGIAPARDFIVRSLYNYESGELEDYKSQLCELVEKKNQTIEFKLISKKGFAHSPEFTIAVLIDGREIAIATAGSKKEAEQKAATICIKSSLY